MRFQILSLFLICLTTTTFSQESTKNKRNEFVKEVVDLAVRLKNSESIQLPNLYDSLFTEFPADSLERMLLAEALKQKGFNVTDWGRGNFSPNGARVIFLKLKRKNCQCEVLKMYYATIDENLYQAHEAIACRELRLPKKTNNKSSN